MTSTKIALALALVSLSSAALAGEPGNNVTPPSGIPLVAPFSSGNWNIGLEALYMQSNTSFQYASLPLGITSEGELQSNNQTVNGDWNWGGEVDVSYIFPGSNRDISGSYTYLTQDSSDSIVAAPGSITPIFGVDLNAPLLTNDADATVDQTLNAATLTMGQLVTICNRLAIHPFGGLQFADINSNNKVRYEAESTSTDILTGNYNATSEFEGIGPRAGIDAHILVAGGLSVVGTIGGAILVGSMDSHFDINDGVATLTPGESENDNYTSVVPELDANLGLNYMFAFSSSISMDAQVGYEFVNYFNAESNDLIDSASINSINNSSDFNYNGPYFRLQLNVV